MNAAAHPADAFTPGTMVLVTLNQPREKYWGALLAVTPAGVAMRGMDLNSFDDFISQVRQGEPVWPHTVFFPMHRVERMELDVHDGEIPSMQERFESKTGQACRALFAGETSPR